MRLRTVVFVSFALLVVVALGVSIGAVTFVTRRAARSQVGTELARSRDVTLELERSRIRLAAALVDLDRALGTPPQGATP